VTVVLVASLVEDELRRAAAEVLPRLAHRRQGRGPRATRPRAADACGLPVVAGPVEAAALRTYQPSLGVEEA
jgi:hypothetical protein